MRVLLKGTLTKEFAANYQDKVGTAGSHGSRRRRRWGLLRVARPASEDATTSQLLLLRLVFPPLLSRVVSGSLLGMVSCVCLCLVEVE